MWHSFQGTLLLLLLMWPSASQAEPLERRASTQLPDSHLHDRDEDHLGIHPLTRRRAPPASHFYQETNEKHPGLRRTSASRWTACIPRGRRQRSHMLPQAVDRIALALPPPCRNH